MSKRIERELQQIDSKSLYKKKLKKSPEDMSEPILLVATSIEKNDSEQSLPGMERKIGPESMKVPPNSPMGMMWNEPHSNDPLFPRSAPHLLVPQVLFTRNKKLESSDNQTDKEEQLNDDVEKTVIVDVESNKNRFSRILKHVNQKKMLRDRKLLFGSQDSLETQMEMTQEKKRRRIDRIKKSKKLLLKYQIYEFLKRPSSFCSTLYHALAFILVMACLVVSVLPQTGPLVQKYGGKAMILDFLEKLVLLWLSLEYLLRLWASECRPMYTGLMGKWRFFIAPAHLIDIFVIILSTMVMLWPHEGHEVFAFRAFRGFHRFFQIIQNIIVKRQLRPWRVFLSVLYDQREQLMIIFYLEIIIFSLYAYLGFLVEHQNNDMLDSVGDAFWWSIVTLTTVGYGDKVPITWKGKLISALFILFGFCMFALPAGIIGAGLALKIEELERSRQRRKRINAAARLIQKAWKCFKNNRSFEELSVYFYHKPQDNKINKVRVFESLSQAFLSNVQFQMAKSNFKQMTRSVDLQNVIESYRYGQMDIFSKLKQLNSSLNIVLNKMVVMEQERIKSIEKLKNTIQKISNTEPISKPGTTMIRAENSTCVIKTVGEHFQQQSLNEKEYSNFEKIGESQIFDIIHFSDDNQKPLRPDFENEKTIRKRTSHSESPRKSYSE